MDREILVIDDDAGIRKLLSAILENANYSVSTAESGLEGLKLFETNTYQLVLLDLRMPGMDGPETIRAMRKIDASTPIYIVSGFHSEFFKELKNLREDGVEFQILKKPIEKENLLSLVNRLLGKALPKRDSIVKLKLYVSNKTKRTEDAIKLLHRLFQNEWGDKYSFELIDIINNPDLAEQDGIIATPTLLKISPAPTKRIIGDFSMRDTLKQALGLKKT